MGFVSFASTFKGREPHTLTLKRWGQMVALSTLVQGSTVFKFNHKEGTMGYEAIVNQPGAYRVSLEERQEGVYVNVFESPSATEPYIDILQTNLDMAKRACKEDYGIEDHQWHEIVDEPWHAPGSEKGTS
jgi:hypothetical protein